jgi:hypothetical protein
MNIFGVFGKSGGSGVTIPTFKQGDGHDSVDLQIKSLQYLFKRLRINKLSPFLNGDGSLKYTDTVIHKDRESLNFFQKLDQMYDTDTFKSKLVDDEYRVMIDYAKNKFRAYCILSDYPSTNLSRPGSPVKGGSFNGESDDFPPFVDYKDRRVKTFRFLLLPVDEVSIEFIANSLSTSDIYVEHFGTLDFGSRFQYAMDSIGRVIKDERFSNKTKLISITENEKELIVQYYVRQLAFNVQLSRIVDEYLKHMPNTSTKASPSIISSKATSSMISPRLTPTLSPTKMSPTRSSPNISTSPSRVTSPTLASPSPNVVSSTLSLSSRKSMAELPLSLRPSSPTKQLSHKPSISKLRLGELYNPEASPQLLEPFSLDSSDTGSDPSPPSISTTKRSEIYEKCKAAVIDKLKKERIKINNKEL